MSASTDPSLPDPSPGSEVLPTLPEEILEARAQALLGALGALELSIGRRLLPPRGGELHPPFTILLSIDRAGREIEPPPPQAFDRLLGEGCSFRMEAAASGVLAEWLRGRGGGSLCGWALPRDRWPSMAILARVNAMWDPGPVRLRVAQRGMEVLARSLGPPSWWMRSSLVRPDAPSASEEEARPEATASLRDAKLRMERSMLQEALRRARGNKTEAARRLQLSRQGLYRKLRRHGLHGDP